MKTLYIFILIIISVSCNDFQIDSSYEESLTVEAYIENGKQARVYLTKSLPIEGVIDSIALIKNIESHAKVIISNGDITEVLSLKRDDEHYPMLYYKSNNLKGEVGRNYTLQIDLSGKSYFSETTVPSKSLINSIIFNPVEGDLTDSLRELNIIVDNAIPSMVKYFKLLIKRDSIYPKYIFPEPPIFTNENTDNTEINIFVKYNYDGDDYRYILGEVVYIKLQRITKEEYVFWKSIKGDKTRLLNMKTFSEEIPSNIDGAFGYWGGQNTSSYRVVVK